MKNKSETIRANLNLYGLDIPEIWIPDETADPTKWSVIACDQYTSDIGYWNDVKQIVSGHPSCLSMIFPEVYLEQESEAQQQQRIRDIQKQMARYCGDGTLRSLGHAFILVERNLSGGKCRKGLLVSIDLESYSYSPDAQSLIRATEQTITSRIPPRMKIRRQVPLELPHIMLLVDDPEYTLIQPLFDQKDRLQKIYDFPLMKDAGHLKGYLIDDARDFEIICNALEVLASPETFRTRYASTSKTLLFTVGDGNHSLATAKAVWEHTKKSLSEAEQADHPARYALAEIVNLHDDALLFEPIHRVLFHMHPGDFFSYITKSEKYKKIQIQYTQFPDADTLRKHMDTKGHCFPFAARDFFGILSIQNPACYLPTDTIQMLLDDYIADHPRVTIDYIHGDETLFCLCGEAQTLGFFLPAIRKQTFFKDILHNGVLPRKTFSMGDADDKRFYFECKKITKKETSHK